MHFQWILQPFGSEYTISIKNHNSIRAAVSIDIDSTDATGGHDLIIEPNATIELKRFIKNGNLSTGNAFKFIERTASIENHRGIGQSDGLVRLSYQFEQPRTTLVFHDVHHYYRDHYYRGMNIGDFNRTGTSIANNLTFGVSQHALRSAKSYTANV